MEANAAQAKATLADGIFKEPVDYVLVHSIEEENKKSRETFEEALENKKISIQSEVINIGGEEKKVFKKLHCNFKRLCEEAERVKLEMPLKVCEVSTLEPSCNIKKTVESDNEADYKNISISAPFKVDKREKFKGIENEETFFRPALRALLTRQILISEGEDENGSNQTPAKKETTKGHRDFNDSCWYWPWSCRSCCRASSDESSHGKGLQSLINKNVYEDHFILHEDSSIRLVRKCICKKENWKPLDTDPRKDIDDTDPRKDMDDSLWFWKFQSLWKIRNYFGEKIALYFAWAELLLGTLLMPAVFGLACFLYGLSISVARSNEDTQMPTNLTVANRFYWQLNNLHEIVRGSFDNGVTPWFALIICLWGTIFLELWKRKNAVLSYRWHVVNYEANEPDRPKAVEQCWIKKCCMQLPLWIPSLLVVLWFGVISVLIIALLRLFIYIEYCGETATLTCAVLSIIIPGIANAAFVMFFGLINNGIAKILTSCEDHDTQTEFDDALIFKMFAFQFANNYASCFYTAFFRGEFDVYGVFGLGEEYSDVCYGGSCISELSIQVIILMLSKPVGKFFTDIIWPPLNYCCSRKTNKCEGNRIEPNSNEESKNKFIRNYNKVPLGEFTLEEYAEKVTLYGFLMLFAAAAPIASMIAVIWLAVDLALDKQRLLWLTRRPVADIAQDIGSWYDILNFVNVLGVISNGFLIAFRSKVGLEYDLTTRLWICIGFQNIVFALKFFFDYIIPDVPKEVTRAIRKDKYEVSRKMKASGEVDENKAGPSKPHKVESKRYAVSKEAAGPQPVDKEKTTKFMKNLP